MKKHDYPKEVTEENFKELVERADEIVSKSSITFASSVVVSLLLLVGVVVYWFSPLVRAAQTPEEFAWISLGISSGLALFVAGFLINFVNIFLRRVFNIIISYYPSPEEFVFAQFILTANLFDKPKSEQSRLIRYRSMYLSEEISRFIKYDPFNFRRKFYAKEFRLLASGETGIGRMLMFSETEKKELLSKFALALVNGEDPKAFLLLKDLIGEIEKYDKLEVLTKRIENKLRKWQSVAALIGGTVAIISTIVKLLIT